MQVEIRELDLRYQRLRLADPERQAQMVASLARHGQQAAVLVVAGEEGHDLLVDGYVRVAALQRLGEDLVEAVRLELGVAEALVLAWQLEAGRRRTALEEGWLLVELEREHGLDQAVLAERLGRSRSWVCRRLALVEVLPEVATEAVRAGRISPQAAMRYLVPLARANEEACTTLVEGLGQERLSVRQAERLYEAWRAGTPAQRERIEQEPLLHARALAAGEAEGPRGEAALRDPKAEELVAALQGVVAGLNRALARLAAGALELASGEQRRALARHWARLQVNYTALAAQMEGSDAGP
jgi:ParB-like chromosome segregation protein Spo0J